MSSSSGRSTNVLGAGMTWVVCVGLFAYGGHLLDEKLATTPVFVIVGALSGAGGGFIHFLANVAPELLPFGRREGTGNSSSSSDSDSPPET